MVQGKVNLQSTSTSTVDTESSKSKYDASCGSRREEKEYRDGNVEKEIREEKKIFTSLASFIKSSEAASPSDSESSLSC